MARKCYDSQGGEIPPGSVSMLDPRRVASVVSFYTSAGDVVDQLIALLLKAGVKPGDISLKLTAFLEKRNQAADVPDRGCCLYDKGSADPACCNLTQEQCDLLGGKFIAGGECK